MADSKYFGIPFASTGDRAAIPIATDPSGAISYQQGFGPDYERDPATDPQAKRVPRDETNEYLYQTTNAIKFLQLYGVPEWFPDDGLGAPVSYPLGARVRYDAGSGLKVWRSLIAANTTTPGADFTQWTPYEEGAFLGVQVFTASGTYTRTPGTRKIRVEVVGAGGGGAGARATAGDTYAGGAGGGGGGAAISFINAPATAPVVIGSGGIGGVNVDPGGSGGTSSFAGTITASGGGGGGGTLGDSYPSGTIIQQEGGGGGVGSGGNIANLRGQKGGNLLLTRVNNSVSGFGGGCLIGFGPESRSGSAGGISGSAGCGGSGALSQSSPGTAYTGGAGGAGSVIVYEYA